MKLSELKLGQKAILTYKKTAQRQIDYTFKGEVVARDGELLISNDGGEKGYLLNPLYDHLWDVNLLS